MLNTSTKQNPLQSNQLVTRLLMEPDLVKAIQTLEPHILEKLINHVGLEDAGELISLITTEQLKNVLDEDLWHKKQPGKDESFDAERFGLWLEVMLEAGEDFAAQKLSELPEDVVTVGFYQNILVIDIDELAIQMSSFSYDEEDMDLTEKALENCLYHEFGGYRVISKNHKSWDGILGILLALDKNHSDLCQRILEHCCYASLEYISGNGGLYQVLTSEEMLESDAFADREDRRAKEGFIAPSQAASFLSLSRMNSVEEIRKSAEPDPITKAYFRFYEKKPSPQKNVSDEISQSTKKLIQFLQKENILQPENPSFFLSGTSPNVQKLVQNPGANQNAGESFAESFSFLEKLSSKKNFGSEKLLRQGLTELYSRNQTIYLKRLQEFTYLTNVLMSGCSVDGRSFRLVEASEAMVATCNLGLEFFLEEKLFLEESNLVSKLTFDILLEQSAVQLFQVGFQILHKKVSFPTLQTLEKIFLHRQDWRDIKNLIYSAKTANKPYILHKHLSTLSSVFDLDRIQILQGCLSEFPFWPRPWTFFSTHEHIQKAENFLGKLENR